MLIKGKVLKILEENKGRNISGEEIAKTLNISRTSIWKAINSLRNEGYVINAVTNKGYSLATNTDFISKEGISLYLNKSCSDIEIYNYKTISSTNEIAKNLALSGAKHGTVVISEEQTAGKGRLGRSFYSPANTGIYMSIILRPNLTAMDSVLITTSSSVIICESIKKVTGIDCQIKWINDIYLNNKKVAGILTEASTNFESGTIDYLILGIGINFNQPKDDFPDELKSIASSLFNNNNNNINRNMLCAEIISNILDMIPRIKNYDFISEYKKRSIVLNQEIIYISSGISSKGKVININCDGSLVVEHDDGSIKILNSGEVSIRRLN
ncbi:MULTISPECIES: biotin--[acetyl-CoA-carboxylase] ligase [unclassified Clostridium]|uniref:biotin--[acetyl-CoA-carboxylase] ligase n=1 Tax=unclassified Clostridium TaxID=2614128 RepID=UPI001C8BA07A|nr:MULTISPECIES: biotin--[acetyl-CoA-carboxylase] ligase [unclassified Clostridium]MBX9136245.1 biotin--[acetyl-CoA-carboxylase] ligase [Clostridium sp. K12(2020)]MBX9143123.1 biotin--[acetyl-CoA-carboxylase] ligase [Clostridium sp. K13]